MTKSKGYWSSKCSKINVFEDFVVNIGRARQNHSFRGLSSGVSITLKFVFPKSTDLSVRMQRGAILRPNSIQMVLTVMAKSCRLPTGLKRVNYVSFLSRVTKIH